MDFLFELIGSILSLFDCLELDNSRKKKLVKNIEKLNNYDWFNELYTNEKYNREFSVNKHIRRYLHSNYRVNNMIKYKKSQLKFIRFLNKQAERK